MKTWAPNHLRAWIFSPSPLHGERAGVRGDATSRVTREKRPFSVLPVWNRQFPRDPRLPVTNWQHFHGKW